MEERFYNDEFWRRELARMRMVNMRKWHDRALLGRTIAKVTGMDEHAGEMAALSASDDEIKEVCKEIVKATPNKG